MRCKSNAISIDFQLEKHSVSRNLDAVILKQIFAIACLLTVSVGYAAQACFASLVSVADRCLNEAGSGSGATSDCDRTTVPPKQQEIELPFNTPMMDTSMSDSRAMSVGVSVCNLDESFRFDPNRFLADKLCLFSWMWVPDHPGDDLLKVPIAG